MVAQRLRGAGNRFLASLSRSDRVLLEALLKPVELKFRQRLEAANARIRTIYFVERGLASVIGIGVRDKPCAEVAVVGREGMTGVACVLGAERSPHETLIQLEGSGQYMSAADLRHAMAESRTLTSSLLRYAHVYGVQVAQTAVANARGTIDERLARWLLMVHDRIDGDDVRLTHEFLALVLGVRRAGVTLALNKLETQQLIANGRGCITVLDRDGLGEVAGGLYGVSEAEFERLFPAG
jgi:CRP-like cAMP-binding protein